MSKVLERLRKKRGTAVVIGDETFHVRSLTIGELRKLDLLSADDKTGFIVGCALCESGDGGRAIEQTPGESDADYAARVLGELSDVPTDAIRALSEGVARIGMTPKMETVIKN